MTSTPRPAAALSISVTDVDVAVDVDGQRPRVGEFQAASEFDLAVQVQGGRAGGHDGHGQRIRVDDHVGVAGGRVLVLLVEAEDEVAALDGGGVVDDELGFEESVALGAVFGHLAGIPRGRGQ